MPGAHLHAGQIEKPHGVPHISYTFIISDYFTFSLSHETRVIRKKQGGIHGLSIPSLLKELYPVKMTTGNIYLSSPQILYTGDSKDMNDNLTAIIIETHRDVRWICRTLREMKETDVDFEDRIRDLEEWRSEKNGAEKRSGGIVAGLSGVAGALAAWVVQWFGVG